MSPPAKEENSVACDPSICEDKGTCDEETDQQITCDVLCALGNGEEGKSEAEKECQKKRLGKSCKQFQLPMFLSKTYHMIDRCDSKIASWSEDGENFIVKNTEQFASSVLPKYFKHSNFSSFARQLNFYGFRKLRTDPILTSDVDPNTSCWVRFYHERFKKDRPELLHQIKRATKSDQQSKDEVEILRNEVTKLRESLAQTTSMYDQKLAELSYECNRRISAMNVEYDKLSALVHSALGRNPPTTAGAVTTGTSAIPDPSRVPDLLHSLSQAAVSLQNHLRAPGLSGLTGTDPIQIVPPAVAAPKRSAEDTTPPPAKNPRTE